MSVDGTANVWDADSGRMLFALSKGSMPADGFTGLVFSPDGEQIAIGGLDGTVTLWDSRSGDTLMTITGHANMVVGLAFNPDGTQLASASWDGTARVWDLSTGMQISTFEGHQAPVLLVGIVFSPDSKRVFNGGDDDFVRM